MARGKSKCPRPGARLTLADGAKVKAAKLDGKVCVKDTIAVERPDGLTVRVSRDELRGGRTGRLGKLGIEWTGPDPHWPGETPSNEPRKYKVVPHVEAAADVEHGVLPPFELARKSLEEQPGAEYVSVQMYPDDPSTPYIYRRDVLEQLLAAEDHYRGIMPPETTFRGLGRTISVPAEHLREDMKEARSMIRELERGIKRDKQALGALSGLSGDLPTHTRMATRYQYAARKAKDDVLVTGLMATDKPNCIAAAPAINKLNEVYGRAWAEGVHAENASPERERMLRLESSVATLNEAFARKCVKGFGAFNGGHQ